ncbi:MAG: GNAT family N-acetyltransferase [Epulopiscium sp.]|nr:GNAT family N-acetyltransferase [Candidatus Epulonipiscium sp.]
MPGFRIRYISTVFVDKDYRKNKIGTLLMNEIEKRTKLFVIERK